MALSMSGEEEEYDSESEQVGAFSLHSTACGAFVSVG